MTKKTIQEFICEVLNISLEDLTKDRYVDCITPSDTIKIVELYCSQTQQHICCHDK